MAIRYESLALPERADGTLWKFSEFKEAKIYKPHNHRELELNLVLEGKGSYIVGGVRYSLEKGSLLWLFPDQRHGIVHFSEDFEMWIAVFRPGFLRALWGEESHLLLSSDPGSVFVKTLNSPVLDKLNALYAQVDREKGDPALYRAGLGYLLLRSWKVYRESGEHPESVNLHPAVARMVQLLGASPEQENLSRLAEKAGLSYSRLSRLFLRQTGKSLISYRDSLRVEKFCEVYRGSPHRTILDCALEAGFGSYAQFYRVFRKHTGQNPGSFPFDRDENLFNLP